MDIGHRYLIREKDYRNKEVVNEVKLIELSPTGNFVKLSYPPYDKEFVNDIWIDPIKLIIVEELTQIQE
jgi:hypothetical protein